MTNMLQRVVQVGGGVSKRIPSLVTRISCSHSGHNLNHPSAVTTQVNPSMMSFHTNPQLLKSHPHPLPEAHVCPAPPSPKSSLPRHLVTLHDAYEIIDHAPESKTHLMLTCEHASMRLPAPWKWPAGDQHLLGQHWSYDPGAEDFTRDLNKRIPSVGVLGRFSRLVCDPNRPLVSETMFRTVADGKPVELNQQHILTAEDKEMRLKHLYRPYHAALKQVFEAIHPTIMLSPHSFTPVYEGQIRTVEIGVLYNSERDRPLAEKFKTAYESAGIQCGLNVPWSAKDGFMYAIDQYSSPTTQCIMFEFRQDLIVQPTWRSKVVELTEQVLRKHQQEKKHGH